MIFAYLSSEILVFICTNHNKHEQLLWFYFNGGQMEYFTLVIVEINVLNI
jgi:hypothetical protein